MPVQRNLWQRSIVGGMAPPWPCPTCSDGKLTVKRDTLHSAETAESRNSHHDEGFDVRQIETMFSTLLECIKCKEVVACCGVGGFDIEDWQDEGGEFYTTDYPIFFPRYFTKPMRLFAPPGKVPLAIRQTLDRSFMLFFADHRAAANLIRQCVEEVMEDASIARKTPEGDFRSFEDRLKEYERGSADNAVLASALRHIGNFGSHPDTLIRDHVLDAYDILEQLLEDQYVGQHRKTREDAARIHKTRKL
jgi:hypothetical protein